MGIMDKFPSHLTPRPVQQQLLEAIERTWDTTDVYCINSPVAAGKSAVARTVAAWCNDAAIITPSKILVQQYRDEFPSLPYMLAVDDFQCSSAACVGKSCREAASLRSVPGPRGGKGKPIYCPDCEYRKRIRMLHAVPYILMNYYTYMAHKCYRSVLIADEAHDLLPMLQDVAAFRYWYHEVEFPRSAYTAYDLLNWLESVGARRSPKQHELYQQLQAVPPRHIVQRGTDMYRGRPTPCIKFLPIDVSETANILWPASRVNKIILMSATIGRRDIEALGLKGRRLTYIDTASPIPVEHRPIYPDCRGNMSYAEQDRNLPQLAEYIKELANRYAPSNGVVHLTYGLAYKLQKLLDSDDFIWHNRSDRSEVYDSFIALPPNSGKVLMACGLEEGIDLKGDRATWQVLAKVPWPSLADPAIKHMASTDEDMYAWMTAKKVLQFSGRVCRTPTDQGASHIFDSSYRRLETLAARHLPRWFTDAITHER